MMAGMESEESELLRQIAQYAGAINRHKQHPSSTEGTRVRPYNVSRRGAHTKQAAIASKNRTLVFAKGPSNTSEETDTVSTSTQWISGRDRGHRTLTNASIYDTSTASKLERINETREARRRAKLIRREKKDAERLKLLVSTTLEHEGLVFRINKKANLLIRVDVDNVVARPTPKRTMINGVEFLKSPKTNNLFRKSTVKLMSKGNKKYKKSKKHCKFFTRTGNHMRSKISTDKI